MLHYKKCFGMLIKDNLSLNSLNEKNIVISYGTRHVRSDLILKYSGIFIPIWKFLYLIFETCKSYVVTTELNNTGSNYQPRHKIINWFSNKLADMTTTLQAKVLACFLDRKFFNSSKICRLLLIKEFSNSVK